MSITCYSNRPLCVTSIDDDDDDDDNDDDDNDNDDDYTTTVHKINPSLTKHASQTTTIQSTHLHSLPAR